MQLLTFLHECALGHYGHQSPVYQSRPQPLHIYLGRLGPIDDAAVHADDGSVSRAGIPGPGPRAWVRGRSVDERAVGYTSIMIRLRHHHQIT